jgi:CBS domain-containing protein
VTKRSGTTLEADNRKEREMADIKVQDVMTNLVVMLYPKDTIHDAAQRLARNGISGAPVVEDGKVVGIVSESDLIHAVMPPVPVNRGASVLDALSTMGRPHSPHHDKALTVAEAMTTAVIQVPPNMGIWQAAALMERKGVKRLPVVDSEDYLLGIISRADLLKAMARDDDAIVEEIEDAVGVLGPETIDGLEIDVTDGIATISGRADRLSTKTLAVKMAGRVPGVVQVVDHMTSLVDDRHIRFPRPEADPKDARLDWSRAETVNGGVR